MKAHNDNDTQLHKGQSRFFDVPGLYTAWEAIGSWVEPRPPWTDTPPCAPRYRVAAVIQNEEGSWFAAMVAKDYTTTELCPVSAFKESWQEANP